MHQNTEKLVSVLVIFALMIEAGRKNKTLVKLPCIHYLIRFKKDIKNTKALLDSGNEINLITSMHSSKYNFCIHYTDIDVQKIDRSSLARIKMIIASF